MEIVGASAELASLTCNTANFIRRQSVGNQLQKAFQHLAECMVILDRDKNIIPEWEVLRILQWYDEVFERYQDTYDTKHWPHNASPRNLLLARSVANKSKRLLDSAISSSQAARRARIESYRLNPDDETGSRVDPNMLVALLSEAIHVVQSEGPSTQATLPVQVLNRLRVRPVVQSAWDADVDPMDSEPAQSIVCRWRNCTQSFPDTEALYTHLCGEHAPPSTGKTRCCGWKSCVHAPAARFASGPGSSRTVVETGVPPTPMPAYVIDEEDSESMHDWKEGKPIIRPMP
ncbi:hypothetical protein DFH07DRAFT_1065843, partial [Mycena maculata]